MRHNLVWVFFSMRSANISDSIEVKFSLHSSQSFKIIFGSDVSGIKGYFATVKISTDNYTNVGGLKELWSVGTKFVQSS